MAKDKQQSLKESIWRFERYIISCMLHDFNVVEDVMSKLELSDFSNSSYSNIYYAIREIHKQGKNINALMVIEYISSNPNLANNIPDYETIINVIDSEYTSSSNAKSYIEYIKEQSIKNQVNRFASQLINEPLDFTKFEDQIYNWQTKFADIVNSKKTDKITSIKEVANNFQVDLANLLSKDRSQLTGTTSGFRSIDNRTDGFQRGDLIILAARPGTGKTALALNFILNAAKEAAKLPANNEKKPAVVLFSIEMNSKQIIERMLANESLTDLWKIKRGDLNPIEKGSVNESIETIANLPILIDDTSGMSIVDIQSKLRQLYANYDIRLVVVDYLQLLKGPNDRFSNSNRQQEVSNISRMLKIIARQINAPIIALAQLSRAIEKRSDSKDPIADRPEPQLSDLRESGAIEQDADLVTFLYYRKNPNQPGEDGETATPVKNDLQGSEIEFVIKKHRNGATGKVPLLFMKNYGKFVEVETNYQGMENNNETK